jgi:hypothetical protein
MQVLLLIILLLSIISICPGRQDTVVPQNLKGSVGREWFISYASQFATQKKIEQKRPVMVIAGRA